MVVRLGLRTRITLAIALVSLVIMTLLTWNRLVLIREILTDRIAARTQTVQSLMAENLMPHMAVGDRDTITHLMNVAVSQPLVHSVVILDAERQILFYASASKQDTEPMLLPDTVNIKTETRNLYVVTAPINPKNLQTGSIQIAYRLDNYRKEVRKVVMWSVAISLAGVLFLAWIAWILSGRIIRPLAALETSAKRIANGSFDERVTCHTDDEIGQLAVAFNMMASRLEDFAAHLRHMVDAATDELQEANIKLHDANKHLLEMDRAKSEFVSIVSHELRTPLTSIIGFAQTLKFTGLSDAQRLHYIDVIEAEGNRMASLIRDFLAISTIQMGRVKLKIVPVEIKPLLKEIAESFSSRPIPLFLTASEFLPAVPADRNQLKQVLINLLDNAFRYAQSCVTVEAKEANGILSLVVADDGPGIPKEDQLRLFQLFYRVNDEITAKSQGSGLGLAISAGIIKEHGGRILVDSNPGAGTRFIVELSLNRNETDSLTIKKQTGKET